MAFALTTSNQLGSTLKGLRKARHLTQVQVAHLSGLGQKTVSLLETAPHRCSVDSLLRYLSAIGAVMSIEHTAPSLSVKEPSPRSGW